METFINSLTSGKIHPRISQLMTHFFFKAPFFSELLLHLNFNQISEEEARQIRKAEGFDPDSPTITLPDKTTIVYPTASVQIQPQLQLNWYEPFIESLSDSELQGLIVHELLHLVHLSHHRFQKAGYYGKELAHLWNIAGDYAINTLILTDLTIDGKPLTLPYTNLTPDELQQNGYTGPITHEKIMEWLLQHSAHSSQSPQPLDDHRHLDNSLLENTPPQSLHRLIQQAHQRGWGTVKGQLCHELDSLLQQSQINWKMILRHLLSLEFGKTTYREMRTWSRPSRREGLPFKIGTNKKVIVAVDTSGSVFDSQLLKEFMTEVEALMKASDQVHLLQFDTKITESRTYQKNDWKNITLKGGGLTNIQCVYDWMKENKKWNDTLIVLTDGRFPTNINTHQITQVIFATTDVDPTKTGRIKGTVIRLK